MNSRQCLAASLAFALVCISLAGGAEAAAPAPTPDFGARIWLGNKSVYFEAGLRPGDLITRADGKGIRNDTDLYQVLAATTQTQSIAVEGVRNVGSADAAAIKATLPNYLPEDVSIGSWGWDWQRYLKYYAPNPLAPDPLLQRAYRAFDNREYPQAEALFTSATRSGRPDPLTTTKIAWLMVRQRTDDIQTRAEQAINLLDKAANAFDQTVGDNETEAKIEGTLLICYDLLDNHSMTGLHGRKAIYAAPAMVGNRINYIASLTRQEQFTEAAMEAKELVQIYPRSVEFLKSLQQACLRSNDPNGVIHACRGLLDINPDHPYARLLLIRSLNEIGDSFEIVTHCDTMLEKHGADLKDRERGEVLYCKAQAFMRRQQEGRAESLVSQAIDLRGFGNEYCLLGNIEFGRKHWKDAIMAYRDALRKPWPGRTRDDIHAVRDHMDESIKKLWSWQVDDMPPDIQRRREWLDERKVLEQSFLVRNRYSIRTTLILIGVLMIATGVLLRVFSSNY